ncbi:MAG: PDZ domain-containing protein [Planctomycetia bacterium]|nr:PDZ domain-containing protein [Planctomycetia bacterium]
MRIAGVSLVVLLSFIAMVPAQEPNAKQLLEAIETQLRAANEIAGPCVGCVVVSRSDLYPKPNNTSERPGKLGSFDPKEFVKANPTTNKRLAKSLDLSDVDNIPDLGFACGVVVDPIGLILTPFHVIEGATKIYVHLPGRVGSYADIQAADARSDLAILKLITPPAGLKAIKFAEVRIDNVGMQRATVFRGKLTVLMANPYLPGFAINKPSAALGSLTNVRFKTTPADPKRESPSESYYKFGTLLEHNAKLNAGVSGAALLNLDSEMIGLTTTTAHLGPGDVAGFAIPMDVNVRRVVDVLRRGEEVEYGFLGVFLSQGDTPIIISQVTPLGPAAEAGVAGGDTITHINGVRVHSYPDLLVHIGLALAGSKVKLTVTRIGAKARDVDVTLAKFGHTQPFIASVRPAPVFGLRVDYGSILSQKLNNNRRGELIGVPSGVCVRELVADSPAAAAFKKLGEGPTRWLITHVNGNAVATPAEFHKAVKGQESIKLTVRDPAEANGREREVTIP